ncbi:hypothetical protein EMCRGX_G026328 [Ephydatia muelleri]
MVFAVLVPAAFIDELLLLLLLLLLILCQCAELIAIAISNQMEEVWIAQQPYLMGVYLNQYMPSLYAVLAKRMASKALRQSEM